VIVVTAERVKLAFVLFLEKDNRMKRYGGRSRKKGWKEEKNNELVIRQSHDHPQSVLPSSVENVVADIPLR
jgi:hypothetical protein